MASTLGSLLRVDLSEILPKHIVKICTAYGYQSSIELVTRTMREIMPASDLSRTSMARELQTPLSRVPATLSQLGNWLDYYIHKLEFGIILGA
eukprot:5088733-Prorocentrum_lima.AAC.1